MKNWKAIEGFEGLYEVSDDGSVKSCAKTYSFGNCSLNTVSEKIMKQRLESNGYCRIKLCKEGRCAMYLVHRLVAAAFIPNPYKKRTVNHLNGNRSDNRICNLEWCTYSENMRHSFDSLGRKGYTPRKLSKDQEDTVAIRRLEGLTQREISIEFNVSQGTISNILNKTHAKRSN